MIQKYIISCHSEKGAIMLPSATGEYIKYSDFVKETETLRDYNFSLQSQLLSEQQDNKELRVLLSKKEKEITAISDRLNNMYLSNRANSTYL
jgi:hypothetical protein